MGDESVKTRQSGAGSGSQQVRTLLLSLSYPTRTSYYSDWRDALCNHPRFACDEVNILTVTPLELARRVDDYDAIIGLHSCNADTLDYLKPIAAALAGRKRPQLLFFIGNEYNSPYFSSAERIALLKTARCDIIATQLLEEAGAFLYAGTGARIVAVPHGLNPSVFKPLPDRARTIDLGLRGYKYPVFLGDDERNRFVNAIGAAARRAGLTFDFSEDKRLDRDDWASFLASSTGTVSTEAGSWYISPDDALMERVVAHLRKERTSFAVSSDSQLRRAARKLPAAVKSILWTIAKRSPLTLDVIADNEVNFESLYHAVFRDTPRAPVYGKAISSRHFEAIGTKTCQIMLKGRYNDILVEDEHYITVDPDRMDCTVALQRLMDPAERTRIADRAYDLVMQSHTYTHRVEVLHELLTSSDHRAA